MCNAVRLPHSNILQILLIFATLCALEGVYSKVHTYHIPSLSLLYGMNYIIFVFIYTSSPVRAKDILALVLAKIANSVHFR